MTSRSALVQKVGSLWVKQHNIVSKLGKTWQLKYVFLKKRSGYETHACLEMYESLEAYNSCQSPKEIKFNEIKYVGNNYSQSKDFPFILIISELKQLQLATRTDSERNEWIEAFAKFVQKPLFNSAGTVDNSSCYHDISAVMNNDDHRLPTEDTRSNNKVHIPRQSYPVKFKDSTLGNYLSSKTDYFIGVGARYITVSTNDPKERSKLSWQLATIKTYNSRPVEGNPSLRLLTIETGRQSSTGRGVFHFLTQHGDQIADQIRVNTNKSYLEKMQSLDTTSGEPESLSSSPRMSTSAPWSGFHSSRHSVKGAEHLGLQLHEVDDAETEANSYIEVFTPQEEVEKFKEMKITRPSVDHGATFPEGDPSGYIMVLPDDVEPNDLARDGGGSSRDGDIVSRDPALDDTNYQAYIEVLGDDEGRGGCFEAGNPGDEKNGKYVDVARIESRDENGSRDGSGSHDGDDEKNESVTQFPMDRSEGSPVSTRGNGRSARGNHVSARWSSRNSQNSSIGDSSMSSDNDVFRDKLNSLAGDVFSEEAGRPSLERAERISENDESECFEEDGDCNATVAMANEDLGEEAQPRKTNNHVNTSEALDEDSANTSSGSDGGRSARNSRESRELHSDEVASGGEEEHRKRTSSDTRTVSSSGDSDGDATNKARSPRHRSMTMPDILQTGKCTSQLLKDFQQGIEKPLEICLVENYHSVLSRSSSVFSETSVIDQLQNPTKTGSFPGVVARHSTGEVKYVCGECGWHKRSKGRKRSVLRKGKKCERCNKVIKVIKSPKSPKKDRGHGILNRVKEKLHRSPSSILDNLEPLTHDRPLPFESHQPSFVKKLKNIQNCGLVSNPALDSVRGQLGIAPSAAHTAQALRIGGNDARTRPRTDSGGNDARPRTDSGGNDTRTRPRTDSGGNDSPRTGSGGNDTRPRTCSGGNDSPTSPKGGAISTSRSEGALGSTLSTPSERLPTTAPGEKNKVLTKTKSSPVISAPVLGTPVELVMSEQGGCEEKLPRIIPVGSLPIVPEDENISVEIGDWYPGSPGVESPPAVPPRTREEPPPVPPRRAGGASVRKDESGKLRRAQTDPSNSLTTVCRGSPTVPAKTRLSRTMTDPGNNVTSINNNIRNAVSLGDLLEDESKTGSNLVTVVSLSLGDGIETPPPLPPRKLSGVAQPPALSPRRASNDSGKQNNCLQRHETDLPISFESEDEVPENCSSESVGQKLLLTSKRSLEARKQFQARSHIYREHVTESEAVNAS